MMTRFKTFLTVVGLVAVLVQVQYLPSVEAIEYTGDGVAIVGTTEPLDINATAGASREDLISYEFASYIAVHFADFNLPDGDSVVISSPDDNDSVSHTYTGQGRDQTGTFIASFISGNSVTVTYNSIGTAQAGQGYRITGYSRGYPNKREESICGDGDQSLPAKCYAPGTNRSEELPLSYKRSHAVARLLINGTYMCTGWLAGTEGHLFTNQHCFEQEDWVLTTDIEFGAESSSCSDECQIMMGCAGKIVATTSTFITSSEDIDYAVVKLPDCVDLSPYGYLQMREDGPVLNESIYVPQHPSGFAKRIVSTVDNGDNTTIRSVEEDGECGKDQVGHDADTTGGSSGSPLIASKDNLVVAIHHCGGCTNTAVDVRTVLMDLAAKNISIQDLVATAGGDDANRPPYAETPCSAQITTGLSSADQNSSMPCIGHNATVAAKTTIAVTPSPITSTKHVSSTLTPTSTSAIASKSTASITSGSKLTASTVASKSTSVSTTTTKASKSGLTSASLSTSTSNAGTKTAKTSATPVSTPATTVSTSSIPTMIATSSSSTSSSTSTTATNLTPTPTKTTSSSVTHSIDSATTTAPSTAPATPGNPITATSTLIPTKKPSTDTSTHTGSSPCTPPTPSKSALIATSIAAMPLTPPTSTIKSRSTLSPTAPSTSPSTTPAMTTTKVTIHSPTPATTKTVSSPSPTTLSTSPSATLATTSSSSGSISTPAVMPATTKPGSKVTTPSPTPAKTTTTTTSSAPTPSSTTVDIDTIVAKLKAAVIGSTPLPPTVTATDSPVATPASTSTSTASEVPTTLTSTTSTSTSMGDDVVRQS